MAHIITLASIPAASSASSIFFFAQVKRGQPPTGNPTASAKYTAAGRPSVPRPMPWEICPTTLPRPSTHAAIRVTFMTEQSNTNTLLMPYREESSSLERLREENARLRQQLEKLTSEPLLPHKSQLGNGCQKCGLLQKMQNEEKNRGPAMRYEAAYVPSWWARLRGKRAHPARMRRDCQYCKATYYELPADGSPT